jgi:RNA polymerase sigma factor (sigma-70 family)
MGQLETTLGGGRENFPETVWSSLVGAAGPEGPQRETALNELAQLYWRPVYKYIRTAGGATIEDAKDLTQEFFGYLLGADVLAKYDRERARFRTFLKAVLGNFLSTTRRDANRLKRGGGRLSVPLDVDLLETSEFLAERQSSTPEQVFDRQWAREIITESLDELRKELRAEKREAHMRVYELYNGLGGGADAPSYASVARETGLSEQQVKDHLAYARTRLEKIVRGRLARRVVSPREIGEEINELLFG